MWRSPGTLRESSDPGMGAPGPEMAAPGQGSVLGSQEWPGGGPGGGPGDDAMQ